MALFFGVVRGFLSLLLRHGTALAELSFPLRYRNCASVWAGLQSIRINTIPYRVSQPHGFNFPHQPHNFPAGSLPLFPLACESPHCRALGNKTGRGPIITSPSPHSSAWIDWRLGLVINCSGGGGGGSGEPTVCWWRVILLWAFVEARSPVGTAAKPSTACQDVMQACLCSKRKGLRQPHKLMGSGHI